MPLTRSSTRMTSAAEARGPSGGLGEAWACARCTFINHAGRVKCTMCDWTSEAANNVEDASNEAWYDDGAREAFDASRGGLTVDSGGEEAESQDNAVGTRGAPEANTMNTWEASFVRLFGRVAKPAAVIFNGACTGAVAGAIAARAARRGVIRGAGIGALAGAAISIEALDLSRLFLRGHTVASAADHRLSCLTTRAATADAARVATSASGHVANARAHRNGVDHGHRRILPQRIEVALAEGDVELVLHELLSGMALGYLGTSGRPGASNGRSAESRVSRRRRGIERGNEDGTGDMLATGRQRHQGATQLHELLEVILVQANVDNMSYEELLERFGPGVDGPPAAPAALISSIPKRRLTGKDLKEWCHKAGERRCCICLEEYRKGDTVKSLPICEHCFHEGCIDTWLKGRNCCPICRVVGVDETALVVEGHAA